MGQLTRLTRRVGIPAAILALALSASACGGSGEAKPKGETTKSTQAAAPKKIITQRWPRYWATTESAETGSSDALGTTYFAGYDDSSVVYNGQDVIRFLDRTTGKQRKQVVLKGRRLVCLSQPARELQNGLVLIATGVSDVDACDRLEAYDAATGTLRWTFSAKRPLGPITLGQRDGVVMFSTSSGSGSDSPADLAALDAETGRVLWRHTGPDYFFGRPAKRDDNCVLNPAIAADRDVVIAFLGCSDYETDKRAALFGIDLKTGEQLWRTEAWDPPAKYGYVGDAESVRPHLLDGRTILASEKNTAVRVDSKTGKVTPFPEPAPLKSGGRTDWWPVCDDFRTYTNIVQQYGNQCAFTNGKQVVFARSLENRGDKRIRIEAEDAETGKSLWVWQDHRKDDQKNYVYHYLEYIGFDSDRDEFWVLRDQKDVVRLDAKTGQRVGEGLAAPPMELATVIAPGPKFVLTRTAGGITNPDGTGVKSGLNYYATDAD